MPRTIQSLPILAPDPESGAHARFQRSRIRAFLRTVIAALVDGRLVNGFEARTNPAKLAEATLYLPTRRAGRMAREIFLDVLKMDAAVLPRIVALGDIDEDELAFAEEAEQYGGVAPLDIPPKLGELERRLTLAQTGRGMGEEPGVGAAWWSAALHRRWRWPVIWRG